MKKITAFLLVLAMLCSFAAAFAEAWTCQNCGKESEGNFCPWCGAKKPAAKVICPSCGAEYDPASGFAFCSECGSPLSSGSADAPSGETASEPSVPDEDGAVSEEAAEPAASETENTQELVGELPQIRQMNDHTFVSGTMINPESYPEVRLISHAPRSLDILSETNNTVSFPLPENTVPDEYDYNRALLIDSRNPECRISYEYVLHYGTTLKKMMDSAPKSRIMLRDDSTKKIFLNKDNLTKAYAFLYLREANSVLEIEYRFVDWDAYPEKEMKEKLTEAIQAEQERVLSSIKYSHTDSNAWWTLGAYSGISMLDGGSKDYRVDLVFPEATLLWKGEMVTARMFPYRVTSGTVNVFVYFAPDVSCDLEINIGTYSYATKQLSEGSSDAVTMTLADGKDWAVDRYGWSKSKTTSLVRMARRLHKHGGLKHQDAVYINLDLSTSGFKLDTKILESFLNALVINISDAPSLNEP